MWRVALALAVAAFACASPSTDARSGACTATPERAPIGRIGGDLAARVPDPIFAGSQVKILWLRRHDRLDRPLRLEALKLDGVGHADVFMGGRTGGIDAEWNAAYPSNVAFDSAGCWRISDADAERSIIVLVVSAAAVR